MNKWDRINAATELGLVPPRGVYSDFGSILSVAGPIIGGLMSSDATQSAANTQAQATNNATGISNAQYQQNRTDLAPWRNTGGAAVGRLGELLGLNVPWQQGMATPTGADNLTSWAQKAGYDLPQGRDWDSRELANLQPGYQAYLNTLPGASAQPAGFGDLTKKFTVGDFYNDPVAQLGFNFGMDQGTKGINNMAAAHGGLNSGANLKALTRYGNDYGTTKAADSYNRFVNDQTNLYNRLAGVAGTGQAAANTTAAAGTANATNVGNMITAQGNARGAATIAGGNALAGGFAGASNNYMNNQLIGQLLANNNTNTNYGAGNGYFGGSGAYNQSAATNNSASYGY